MKFFKVIAFCLIIAGVLSCSKHTTEAPPDLGYNYYPAKMKSYIIYDVDSICYNPLKADTETYKFQIKEKIDSLFNDNQGRPTIKIIRYKKIYSATVPYSQMTWTLQDVWMANVTKTDVEVVEENIRYTKLAFPAKLNGNWNGTAQAYIDPGGANSYTFTAAANTFTYSAYDVPSSFGNLSFQKTLTVNQYSSVPGNAIAFQNYNEKYARNVGLIYKELTNYIYYQDPQGNIHPGVIYQGTRYVMTINFYGVE